MGALMWPEAGMLDHVALETEREGHSQAPAPPHRLFPGLLHPAPGTYPDLRPEGCSEWTVGTLEGAGPNVGSLVTLHFCSPCEHGCANLA